MTQTTLRPHENCSFEYPCDDTVSSLDLKAIGGKCLVAIQSSTDGLTWGSPVAHARLDSEKATIPFRLPERTVKIRALVENTSQEPAHVEIEEPSNSGALPSVAATV